LIAKGAATHPARHQLGDIGVDGDDLDADADAGEKPPQQHAAGCGLACHRHRRRGIAEQRPGEDRAPSEPVGEKTQKEGADEQPGKGRRHKRADPRKTEKGLGRGGQQSAAGKARRDVAGKEQVIDLEPAAERQQDHQTPHIGRSWQAFEPPRYFIRPAAPGAMRGSSVDFGCAHQDSPQAGPPLRAVAVFRSFWFESVQCPIFHSIGSWPARAALWNSEYTVPQIIFSRGRLKA
jgi:hypothetical protein